MGRYFAELDGKREAWEPIGRGGVVLLFSARNAEHNNAVALRDYLAAKIKKSWSPHSLLPTLS